MKRPLLVLLAGLTCLSCAAPRVWALEDPQRNGFFVGFGLGAGNATWDWTFESDDSPSEGSGTVHLRVGGAPRSDLLLGLEVAVWARNYDVVAAGVNVADVKVTFSATTFAATWFPGDLGWFLRGGVGFASARGEVDVNIPVPDSFSIEQSEEGVAVLGATGYEWRLTRKFAVGPEVEVFYLGVDGDVVKDVVVVDGSMEFTWYW